ADSEFACAMLVDGTPKWEDAVPGGVDPRADKDAFTHSLALEAIVPAVVALNAAYLAGTTEAAKQDGVIAILAKSFDNWMDDYRWVGGDLFRAIADGSITEKDVADVPIGGARASIDLSEIGRRMATATGRKWSGDLAGPVDEQHEFTPV